MRENRLAAGALPRTPPGGRGLQRVCLNSLLCCGTYYKLSAGMLSRPGIIPRTREHWDHMCRYQWYFSFEIHFSFSFYKFYKQSFLFLYYYSFVQCNYFSFFISFASNHFYIYFIIVLSNTVIFVRASFMQWTLNQKIIWFCLKWLPTRLTGSQTLPQTVTTQYSLCSNTGQYSEHKSWISQSILLFSKMLRGSGFVAHAHF